MVFPSTPANQWNSILDSSDFKNVNRYFELACHRDSSESPRKSTIIDWKKALPSKECWHRSLLRACKMWSLLGRCQKVKEGHCEHWTSTSWTSDRQGKLMVMGPRYFELLHSPVWRTLCFLMKGTYYIENGISLTRLQDEKSDDFILHAAIGSLPYTCTDVNRIFLEPDTWRHAELVFGCVFKFYGDQLQQVGPIDNHLPLHVAASNPGPFCRDIRRLTITGGALVDNRHINDTMFAHVLSRSTPSAIESRDVNQLNPVQLACLNGHRLNENLKHLRRKILQETSLGSSAVCLAIGTSRVPDSPAPQWRSTVEKGCHFIRKRTSGSSYYGGVYCKNNEGHRRTLDSVFTMLRADPAFLSHGVRDEHK